MMLWASLPNIDYSPLLDAAWWLLQFSFKWAGFLALFVFVLVIITGAADLLGDIFTWGKKPRKGIDPIKDKISRTKE
jgi:hypothetical protein